MGKEVHCVDCVRFDGVFTGHPAGVGDQRRPCKKVSRNGHQGASKSKNRQQGFRCRKGATGLLSRLRQQGRQDGKLNVLWRSSGSKKKVRAPSTGHSCRVSHKKSLLSRAGERNDTRKNMLSIGCIARAWKYCRCVCAGYRRYRGGRHRPKIKYGYRCGRHCDQRDRREDRERPLVTTNPSGNQHNKPSAKSTTPIKHAGPGANKSAAATIWIAIENYIFYENTPASYPLPQLS